MAYEPAVDADIALRDGRRIAYCEWGDREGWPILLCHGAPGSRMFGPDSKTTAEAGVRLITVDRPGYGRSDPKPGRQILDWPADVEELAGALRVDEFDVAGHSSGGPYALACASTFPGRVKRVALISCIAPYDEPSSEAGDDEQLTRLARQDLGRAAEEIANRVGIMSHGRLLFDGTLDTLRQRFPIEKQSLETMYLALTENNGDAAEGADQEDLTQRR